MIVFDSSKHSVGALPPTIREWVYNCFDCALTSEVSSVLLPELDEISASVYKFEMACEPIALEMMLRGMNVDEKARGFMLGVKSRFITRLEGWLSAEAARLIAAANLTCHLWEVPAKKGRGGKPDVTAHISFNPASPQQKQALLEGLGHHLLLDRKTKKPTTGRTSLDSILGRGVGRGLRLVEGLLLHSVHEKERQALNSGLGPDGRMHYSLNVGATETARWSSGKDCFKSGMGVQNVKAGIRTIFIPDTGWQMGNVDLKQAESYTIAQLAQEEAYIRAHETGDVHLMVAKLWWPDAGWTGNMKTDLEIANRPFILHHGRRFIAKKIVHGSNLGGTKKMLARETKLPEKKCYELQQQVFSLFPGISRWQMATVTTLRDRGEVVTPRIDPAGWRVRFRRQFFNRAWDASTGREALATIPQAVVSLVTSVGMLRIAAAFPRERLQLLQNGYDSLLFQHRPDVTKEEKALLLACMAVKIELDNGKRFVIPADAKWGAANWRALK